MRAGRRICGFALAVLALGATGCSGGTDEGPQLGDGHYLEYASGGKDTLRLTFLHAEDGLRVSTSPDDPQRGPQIPLDPALRMADGQVLTPSRLFSGAPEAPLWIPPDARTVGEPVWKLSSRYAPGVESPEVTIVGTESVAGRKAWKAAYHRKTAMALKNFTINTFYEVQTGLLLRYEYKTGSGRVKEFSLVSSNVPALK